MPPTEYPKGTRFVLDEGNIITIPHGAICCRAKTRKQFPETPKVIHLRPAEGTDTFDFFFDNSPKGHPAKGPRFILFVPKDVYPGDRVMIKWRDPNCACAEMLETAS